MLDQITEFVKTNTVAVVIGVVALIALVFIFMYKRGESFSNVATMPPHDFEGMESMNTVCDLASGVCHPPEEHNEQEQLMQQQMMQQQQQMMEHQQGEEQQTTM
jgi:hypothetical protein